MAVNQNPELAVFSISLLKDYFCWEYLMIIIVENHNPNFMSWIIFLFLSSSIEWIKIKIDRKQGPDYADHQDKKIYFANEKIISTVLFFT